MAHMCPLPLTWMHVRAHKTFYLKRPWPWIGTMSKNEHIILLSYSIRYLITTITGVIKDNPTEPGQLLGDATCRKHQVLTWHGRAPHVVDTFKIKANRSSQKHSCCEWKQAHRGVTGQATHLKDNRTSEAPRFPLFSASLESLYAQRLNGCFPSLEKYAPVFNARKALGWMPRDA